LLLAAAVLVSVSVSSAWLALSTRNATDSAAGAARLDDAYQRSRISLARLIVLERDVQLSESPTKAAQLRLGVQRLSNSIDQIAATGSAVDRQAAARLRGELPKLRQQLDALSRGAVTNDNFAATDRARTALRQIQTRMVVDISDAAAGHRTRSVAAFDAARRSETVVFGETLFSAILGLLLVLAGMRIVRYKTTLDEAQAIELERLRGAALTDSLTLMLNHRAFHERLDSELAGGDVALVMVDLDGLKEVNDSAGHQAGDEVIRALADGLRRTVQNEHVACRIGGDEFAVIVPGGSAMDGFYLAQVLRDELRDPVAGAPVVAATAGVAEAAAGTDKDTLIRRADLALIEAKRAHRGALVYSVDLETVLDADAGVAKHHVTTLASALARAVDAKDAYTHSHCETVAELCALIATEIGMPPERIAKVRLAGLLHDVGKIGISDAILQKPGSLTAEEFEVMKTHPTLGCNIVSAAELFEEAGWILHHHERLDGRGYPDGLRGEDVPLESRIIMVADAFEAITADRPYRDRRSVAEALAELNRHAGAQFDRQCLRALERIVVGGGVVTQLPVPLRIAA
jgi:diguanylate cyclase (GGDEF)-like protein